VVADDFCKLLHFIRRKHLNVKTTMTSGNEETSTESPPAPFPLGCEACLKSACEFSV
jgi:hypothetical protein